MRRLPCNDSHWNNDSTYLWKIHHRLIKKTRAPHNKHTKLCIYSFGNTRASSSISVPHWLLTICLGALTVRGWAETCRRRWGRVWILHYWQARAPAGLLKGLQTPAAAAADGRGGFAKWSETSLISGESSPDRTWRPICKLQRQKQIRSLMTARIYILSFSFTIQQKPFFSPRRDFYAAATANCI